LARGQGRGHQLRAEVLVALFDVETRNETQRYFLPLVLALERHDDTGWTKLQPAAVARVRQQSFMGVLADAFADDRFCRALVEQVGKGATLRMAQGHLHCRPTKAFPELRGDPNAELALANPITQGSNTALRVGDRLFLKALRRVQTGVNPELEIGRFLTEVAHFTNVVPLAGSVEYVAQDGTPATLALLQGFVQNQGDGWDYTLNYLVRYLEDRRTLAPALPDAHGAYLALVQTLGQRTAELHRALATPSEEVAFQPEPITKADIEHWSERVRQEAEATFELVSQPQDLPEAVRDDAARLLVQRSFLLRKLRLPAELPRGLKLRQHGDYHLGQVLLQRNDFIIVDFEGEPGRPIEARREKASPLRDVAGMLRSFTYAHHAALRRCSASTAEDCQRWEPLLASWERETRTTFLQSYDEVARGAGLYESFEQMQPLLALFEAEKALYELRYELRNRPDWASIPLGSLLKLAAGPR
jgi:maltose alpha-D-glucosyltransferase / alpha-amylase